MAGIFTKIINREIPSYKVAEDDFCYAFLDINPLTKGHALVVPKLEIDQLFDLSINEYNRLMMFSRSVAIAIKKAVNCKRVAVVVLGFEVPHAHIHLIPVDLEEQVNFSNPRLKLSSFEMNEIANSIHLQIV